MDLLEYQAKQLFAEVGIPVLPSQSLFHASDLKNLHIPYPIVLKSQVLASERIKYGGVRFVENTIDAIAVAQSLFNLPIKGEYPQVILAEARYDLENELFLAIIIDYALKKPVLLGSACGGDNLEHLLKNLQQCVIEEEFSPFYARQLAIKMGLEGNCVTAVAQILEKMYHLMITYDLDLIEINPLGINHQGEVMALDGKIRINDYALNRHPHLLEYCYGDAQYQYLINYDYETNSVDIEPESYQELTLNLDAHLAIVTDNIDKTIFTLKSLEKHQEKIHNFLILPVKNRQYWLNNIDNFLFKIIQTENINIFLINHSNKDDFVNILIEKITNYYQKHHIYNNSDSEYHSEGLNVIKNNNSLKTMSNSSLPQREIHWIINHQLIFSQAKLTAERENLPIYITKSLSKAIDLIKNISQGQIKINDQSADEQRLLEQVPLELIKIPSNTKITQRELMKMTDKGIGTINRWVKGEVKNIPSWFQDYIKIKVEDGKKIMYRK
jgi:succinyl-CoA synthetase beta subunit